VPACLPRRFHLRRWGLRFSVQSSVRCQSRNDCCVVESDTSGCHPKPRPLAAEADRELPHGQYDMQLLSQGPMHDPMHKPVAGPAPTHEFEQSGVHAPLQSLAVRSANQRWPLVLP
jgi:hypothetical protein